jgi:hypothetical protein|tara:strand:+ start:287 stop:685 length:399 start_codon:yes stop_codon:yes gene_type:complete
MSNKKLIFKEFNETYLKLLNFLKDHSNGDKLFSSFYNKNYIMKKTNIKMFIKYWYDNITSLYYEQIKQGDLKFFLEKDYNNEVNKMNDLSFNISSYIEFFRNKYDSLEPCIIENFITQMKQLNCLSYSYYNI